ncbi:MAG: Gfo/Idh/MocA family protein [Limisphaerales bacterium]
MIPASSSRRRFLKTAATLTAASTVPGWFEAEAKESRRPRVPLAANDRPALALVGCGGMGRHDAKLASVFCDIVALCDVDEARLDEAQKQWPAAKRYRDYRDCLQHPGLHAIINATPDHWHTFINLAAVRSGKDVYSEKPLTLTIDEGRRLVEAVRANGTIFQTGSQQRSDKRFRLAVELVRNGRLGRLKHITTSLPSGPHGGPFTPSAPPASLDWNLWQGQTPELPYVKERCHGMFRYWWEYSAGTLTDWGAHHNDIALWGLGLPLSEAGPVHVEGHALRDPVPGGYSFPSTYFVHYRYANGVTHTCRTVQTEGGSGNVLDPRTPPAQMPNGVLFEGSDGWIFVTRGRIEASRPEILEEPLTRRTWSAEVSDDHMGNFFEGMRRRQTPICGAEVGHRSVSLCHLGAIAIRLGRPLQWNAQRERFVEDREADAWIARPQRRGFGYQEWT